LAASLLELAIKIVIGCDAPGQLVPDLSLTKPEHEEHEFWLS